MITAATETDPAADPAGNENSTRCDDSVRDSGRGDGLEAGPGLPPPLSADWIKWLSVTLASRRTEDVTAAVVEHRVTDGADREFCWHVRLADGRASVIEGPAVPAEGATILTFESDIRTARAIALGEASAQRAFLEGRLRLRGDARLLIATRPAFEALMKNP